MNRAEKLKQNLQQNTSPKPLPRNGSFSNVTPNPQPQPQQQPQLQQDYTLPPGWEQKMDPQGRRYFIDHNTKRSTYDDPRKSTPPINNSNQNNDTNNSNNGGFLGGLAALANGLNSLNLLQQNQQQNSNQPVQTNPGLERAQSSPFAGLGIGNGLSKNLPAINKAALQQLFGYY